MKDYLNRPEQSSVLLLGYHGNLNVEGLGSASLYRTPVTTNTGITCVITAKHNLTNKETGQLFDGLLLKINMPHNAKPRYVKVPPNTTVRRIIGLHRAGWILVAIPLPPRVLEGIDFGTFSEDQIVTPTSAEETDVVPGLVVQMFCIQFEYENPIDFMMPETFPTTRYGHLSRLGFYKHDNDIDVRSHVIDLHSSPGNSGATVEVLVPRKDGIVTIPMFLGIVQGFSEESGSYVPYQAPITNSAVHPTSITLRTRSKWKNK